MGKILEPTGHVKGSAMEIVGIGDTRLPALW
jgi:hypothetical protein